MSDNTDIDTLRRILSTCRTIAVVGLSADWFRPSYFAAKYMLEHGYRIRVIETKFETVGVDTPEDLELARALFEREKDKF